MIVVVEGDHRGKAVEDGDKKERQYRKKAIKRKEGKAIKEEGQEEERQ